MQNENTKIREKIFLNGCEILAKLFEKQIDSK